MDITKTNHTHVAFMRTDVMELSFLFVTSTSRMGFSNSVQFPAYNSNLDVLYSTDKTRTLR